MIQFRPLPVMTVLALLALVVLLTAGRWQWDKYELKRAASEAPVPEMTIASYEPIAEGLQFVYGLRTDTQEQGWRVFAPVQYGDTIVFIDCDFIPGAEIPNWNEVRFPAALSFGAPVRSASLRPEPAAAFTPPPRPLQRAWFAVDLAAMGRNAGLENVADYYLAASYLGADGRSTANPFALGPGVDPLPPARHLGYALTWWGLAVVLLGVYFAYHVSVGRLKLRPAKRED
jgi:surfeit locus 1 family protein